ncbi:MAG: type 1 glutamine amidotransferase [Pseudomonadota bacterium]
MSGQLRIAILDAVERVYWKDDEGISDSQKFAELLMPQNPAAVVDTYVATEHDFPSDIEDYDAYLITGSPSSVHDNDDWIKRLAQWIVDANDRNKRLIGSCFGHQLIAHTFGGSVEYNEDGWMIGVYDLQIVAQHDWMHPSVPTTGIYHFNQQRVTRLPDSATAFAHSERYPNFAYTIGKNIMSVQGHPEQPLRAMNNFLRCMTSIDQQQRDQAQARIHLKAPDADVWAQWMMRFFES